MSRLPQSRYFAVAVAAFLVFPQAARAEPFCDYLKQVLAAKENGFGNLRGAPTAANPEIFESTLKVQADARCETYSFDGGGDHNCTFNSYATQAEGEPLYNDLAGQMRRCFPDVAMEEQSGVWETEIGAGGLRLSGVTEGHKIALSLSNFSSMFKRWYEKKKTGQESTPVSYVMNVSVRTN